MGHIVSFLSDGCTKTANTMEEAKMGREFEGTAQVSMRSEHEEKSEGWRIWHDNDNNLRID